MENKKCSNCCNCSGIQQTQLMGKMFPCVSCEVYPNRLFTEADMRSKDCEYYNVNTREMKICKNCKHFLGGGDWGLACAKDYYKLPEARSKACEDFEKKD